MARSFVADGCGKVNRSSRYPIGATVRLDELTVDPYPILARLRAHEPISWVPEVGMWFVTRRDDIVTILRDPETFTTDTPHSTIRDIFGVHMMTTEGPAQLRYKKKCIPPFQTSRLQEESVSSVENEVTRLVTDMVGRGEAELCSELARPVALSSVMDILGLPRRTAARVDEWYEHFARALANFTGEPGLRAVGKGAAAEFGTALEPILEDLRRTPDRSLLSDLVCDHVDPLSRDEIVSNALIILFGGIETTEAMIANTLWALFSHSEDLAHVREGRVRVDEAIEESLRWDASVQSAMRHLARPLTMRGAVIGEGEAVLCMLGAANRDPAHFVDPDRFDIRRPNAGDHLSFAMGRHFCLGAPLARLETKTVVETLLSRLSGIHLDETRPSSPRGYEFRKPPTLWMRWSPVA